MKKDSKTHAVGGRLGGTGKVAGSNSGDTLVKQDVRTKREKLSREFEGHPFSKGKSLKP